MTEASGQFHVQPALPQGKNPVPIEYEAGWAPEPVRAFSISLNYCLTETSVRLNVMQSEITLTACRHPGNEG